MTDELVTKFEVKIHDEWVDGAMLVYYDEPNGTMTLTLPHRKKQRLVQVQFEDQDKTWRAYDE
jgi:hypothetical protein